jgi:hypothetical protein
MIVGVFPTIRRWRAVRYAALTTLFIFSTLPYQPVSAYQTTLDSRTIGEAYVLGQRNDKVTADFVAPYISQVTQEGLDGLHRADIELLTPFLQIVDRSKDNSKGYSVEQAADDYRARGDIVILRVTLVLPSNYPTPTANGAPAAACDNTALLPQNFWKNFFFVVKQSGKALHPSSAKNEPIYSASTKDAAANLDGATVWLQFDARDITSGQLEVNIITPHCKTIEAVFNLAALR